MNKLVFSVSKERQNILFEKKADQPMLMIASSEKFANFNTYYISTRR